MRTQKELKGVLLSDFTLAERVRAVVCHEFALPDISPKQVLKTALPELISVHAEERKACDEMFALDPGPPFIREWDVQLKRWEELIDIGLKFGAEHEVWHAKGTKCNRCTTPLQGIERGVCKKCRSGSILPPT